MSGGDISLTQRGLIGAKTAELPQTLSRVSKLPFCQIERKMLSGKNYLEFLSDYIRTPQNLIRFQFWSNVWGKLGSNRGRSELGENETGFLNSQFLELRFKPRIIPEVILLNHHHICKKKVLSGFGVERSKSLCLWIPKFGTIFQTNIAPKVME